jgi:hypothetical protein
MNADGRTYCFDTGPTISVYEEFSAIGALATSGPLACAQR